MLGGNLGSLLYGDVSVMHKFSDRQVWANSSDPDHTAPRSLFAMLIALFEFTFKLLCVIKIQKLHAT